MAKLSMFQLEWSASNSIQPDPAARRVISRVMAGCMSMPKQSPEHSYIWDAHSRRTEHRESCSGCFLSHNAVLVRPLGTAITCSLSAKQPTAGLAWTSGGDARLLGH